MITREELHEMVWTEPVATVAERFAVSGSYMARVCTALGVPRPPRGYWAKKAVGRAAPAPALPDARPGGPTFWSRDRDKAMPLKSFYLPLPGGRASVSEDGVHGLVDGASDHFRSGKPGNGTGYLRPRKKLLVDVTTSEAALEKCLDFANRLFVSLEARGHSVCIAPAFGGFFRAAIERREHPRKSDCPPGADAWCPMRPTVAYFGGVPIGLAIAEMSEHVRMRYVGDGRFVREAGYRRPNPSRHAFDYTWPRTMDVPSGRLKLVAYCPVPRASWNQEWQEKPGAELDGSICEIVETLEKAAAALASRLGAAGDGLRRN